MESRKLIKFGKNSLVLSLPKKWVNNNNVSKGDRVFISNDGQKLVIDPENKEQREAKKILIETVNKSRETVIREIIGAYINNYKQIEIKGEMLEKLEDENKIRKTIKTLMVFEIMDLGENYILAKDFLNLEDISIEQILERTSRFIDTMIQISLNNISKNKIISLQDIDQDINKQYYLVRRIVNGAFQDAQMLDSLKTSYKNLLDARIIMDCFEKMGDEIKRLVKDYDLIREKTSKNALEEIKKVLEEVHELYKKSIISYTSQDKKLADYCSTKGKEIIKECNDLILAKDQQLSSKVISRCINISDHIREISKIPLSIDGFVLKVCEAKRKDFGRVFCHKSQSE